MTTTSRSSRVAAIVPRVGVVGAQSASPISVRPSRRRRQRRKLKGLLAPLACHSAVKLIRPRVEPQTLGVEPVLDEHALGREPRRVRLKQADVVGYTRRVDAEASPAGDRFERARVDRLHGWFLSLKLMVHCL